MVQFVSRIKRFFIRLFRRDRTFPGETGTPSDDPISEYGTDASYPYSLASSIETELINTEGYFYRPPDQVVRHVNAIFRGIPHLSFAVAAPAA